MKQLYFIFCLALLCLLQSCNKSLSDCTEIAYGNSFNAKLNDAFCLPDGKSFTIIDIVDGRCPCDVTCIWEGAVFIKVEVAYENGEKIGLSFTESRLTIANEKSDGFVPAMVSYKMLAEVDCAPNKAEDFEIEILVKKE
jgi:hypothetical protein